MRVVAAQPAGGPDKSANLAEIGAMVAGAAADGAGLVAFPEYAMFKQAVRDDAFLDKAEALDGPFANSIRTLAREHSVAIVVGMNEAIDEDRRAANTLLLVDGQGNDIGAYRKIHLYDSFGGSESTWIRPGSLDQQMVFDIGELRVGVMTCYDLRFPELARVLIDQGAQAILVPSAWTPGPRKEDHWVTLVRARAIENVSYVVAPGLAPPLCTGGSLIVDPMGVVLAEVGENVGMASADLTAERVAEVRRRNPALEHRRFSKTSIAERALR